MKKITLFIILVFLIKLLIAQNISITGKIFDASGNSLPGVNVVIKGTTIGTITDVDGVYSIEAKGTDILVYSFIGYVKQELSVKNRSKINVVLVESVENLDEVVVIGYGTQRKKDITVSISSIKARDVASPVVTSLDQSLQGQASGVVVSQSTGKPGSPVSIRIRGTTSINGTNEPLYVIDGIPIITKAEELTSGTLQGSEINPLSSINPVDIESIQILKDASATAIYGARGANGVILITTKRGKKGPLQVSLNSSVGVQKLSKKLDLLNAHELAVLGNDAVTEARKYYPGVAYNDAFALPNRFGEGTDWQDQIFRTAMFSNHQISIRGGNDNTVYFMSANLMQQEGIIRNSDFNKGTFRINLDNNLSKTVKSGVNLNFTRSINHGVITGIPNVASSVTAMALLFNPGQDVYDETIEGGYTYESNTMNRIPNPVAEINETKRVINSNRLIGDYYLDWDIIENLKFKFKAGIDAFFNKEQQFIPSFVRRGQDKGKGYNVNMQGYTWLLENTLTYTKDFDKHHFNILGGQTAQKYVSEITDIAVERFDDNRLGYYNLGAGLDKTINTGYSTWAMVSGIGRVIYNYDSKYYLTFSGRLDGSSKFGESHKYGFFPSVSAAWRITGENFMKSLDVINDLKLRMSAGTVGNEGIPSGVTLSTMGTLPYFYGEGANAEVLGTYVASLKNEDLKWEVTKQYDLGFDLSMYKSRIEFTTEVYLKSTSDLLLFLPVNRSSGFEYVWSNIGDLENRGLELSLNTVNFDNDFKWSTRLNISFNKNEVTNLDKSTDIYGTPVMNISDWTIIREGEPVGVIYGYKSDGIIQLDEDPTTVPFFPSKIPRYGDRKYVDKNGDGKLTVDDHFKLGNTNPDFSYGFKNTFSYKRLTLDIYLQGDYGNEIVNFNRFMLESFDGFQNNSTVALDRWTETNPTNEYPRANVSTHGNVMSDVIVEDGSYLRLKDITLSYNLPFNIINRIKIKGLQISISGRNLLTFTKYSGYDPEVSIFGGSVFGKGADYGSYPMSKSVVFSLNATF
ncbi:MAG: TonB-dependent receptor [Bacteroidetes bacterium]|nr:MAG: TonB-dependent receptor [Bacteroidota bacterium]